jgi:hypothetical protein
MSTDATSPLRQRMIEDMSARKLNPHTRRIHIRPAWFAAYLKRSRVQFFRAHAVLADTNAFAAFLVSLRRSEWVIYSKACL